MSTIRQSLEDHRSCTSPCEGQASSRDTSGAPKCSPRDRSPTGRSQRAGERAHSPAPYSSRSSHVQDGAFLPHHFRTRGSERTLRRSYGHGCDEPDRSLPVSMQSEMLVRRRPPSGSANQQSSGEQPDATAATERKTRQALSILWRDRAHSCWWPRGVAHTQCTLVACRELLHAHPCADPWTFRAASSTAARMRR